MKVSEVGVSLKAQDILSIINDFVKVEGLTITKLEIGDELSVEGVFEKVVSLGFKAKVKIIGVSDNKLRLNIASASLMSVGILKPFRKLGLKIGLKGFKDQGILVSGDEIIIDINTILNKFPFISLNLSNVWIEKEAIHASVKEIDFSFSKFNEPAIEIEVEEKIEGQEKDDDYIMNIEVNKVDDVYTHGREYVVDHIPEKGKPYKDYIMFIPDIVALVYRLFKDKRVSMKTKITLGVSLGYVALPFDIIPDKIPIIGSLDEITVIFFALNRIIADVPIEIILENWQGKNEFIIVLKNAVNFLSDFTGAKNLDNIYEVIDTLVTN